MTKTGSGQTQGGLNEGGVSHSYGPIYELWFDGGVPVELADDIGVLVDSHAPDAVSFQGPSRHSAGLSGNVVTIIHTGVYSCAHIRTLPRYSLSTIALHG
jgi:hypothetical protein